MTKATIPLPDADGYWHYTYVTYHPDTGEWYGGKHSTNNLNDGYVGSGNWVLTHPGRQELVTKIVEFFYSEEHAYAAEMALVTLSCIDADPLCRNETEGGLGFSREAAARRDADLEYQRRNGAGRAKRSANPEWHKNRNAALARVYADPEWQRKTREANARLAADPEWRQKIREANVRKVADPEWQKKHLEGIRRRTADPEWRRKNHEAALRRAADPEWHRKIRERHADPEYQRKKREGIARYQAKRRLADADSAAEPAHA